MAITNIEQNAKDYINDEAIINKVINKDGTETNLREALGIDALIAAISGGGGGGGGQDLSNYYTKSETDTRITTVVTAQVSGAVDAAIASHISLADDSRIGDLVDLFN